MRIKNLPSIESMNGSQDALVIEQTDGSEDKSRKVSPAQIKQYVLGNSIDDIYSVMGQMGAKNLFNSQYSAPRTNAETTATLGDDGHLIINGTANADAAQLLRPGTTIKPINGLKVGNKLILSYKVISGTFTHGSSSNTTTLYFNNKNGSAVNPISFPSSLSAGDGDSKEITLTDVCFTDGILDLKDIQIYMRSGDTFNNLELAIMLRLASDTDETYQPYAKTNKELTEAMGDLSQTGLTGDSVAEQLTIAKNQIAARTECFTSSSNGTAQSIKIGAIAENRIFLFACGFHTNYVLELIAISSNGANVVHVPVANSSINSISNITYDANTGVMTITVLNDPFGYGRMTRLS